MPMSLSAALNIDPAELTDRGAFDPVLDLDTRLFLDPHLLKQCDVPEFTASYTALTHHFTSIGKLLKLSKEVGDLFWREADRMMQWPEVKGLCIGYSKAGTSGSGIGPELRRRLLSTAKEIIDAGQEDPEIFELVGLLEGDFGPDRISDMTANIIRNDLEAFTMNILDDLGIDLTDRIRVDSDTKLPINPFTEKPVLLVPKVLLRDLPVALDWSDLDRIAYENQATRAQVNHIIGDSWRYAVNNTTKTELKEILIKNPDLLEDLVATYARKEAHPYDFLEDRTGEYIWYPVARRVTKENPLDLSIPESPTGDDVEALVLRIVEQFQTLIEENGLARLLWNSDGTRKPESAAQLLFYGICEAYCDANKIMIARESDSGRGPVDFKFGTYRENSVLVEVKKSTNTSGLKKGIERQLPQYMKSEKSRRAIYLVIDVGLSKAAEKNMREIRKQIFGYPIKVVEINGHIQVSASKL